MIEKLQSNFDVVIQRIEGVESRLASLEIVTKVILKTQRTMQAQHKKLQESVETKEKTPQPPTFEEPKKPTMVTAYPPPPTVTSVAPSSYSSVTPSSYSSVTPSSYYSTPPPMAYATPSLVPVSHVTPPVDQCKSDAELAKRLQAEFDQEQSKPTPKPTPTPTPAPAPSKPQSQECPICQAKVQAADLEAHVEQHFEDDEGRRTAAKPTDIKKDTPAQSKGFFGKLFSKDDEKKPETPLAPPSSKSSESNSTSHSNSNSASVSNSNSNSNSGAHPNATPVVAYPGAYAMAPRAYYAPGMMQGQFRPGAAAYYPTAAYPQQRGMQQQQFLYYPTLDGQPPQ
jgi:hypothetical protein